MSPPIRALCLDVMDTVIRDPWREAIQQTTGLSVEKVAELRDPHAWSAFERGEIDERGYAERFFPAGCGHSLDARALREALRRRYAFVPGMERLLERLAAGPLPLFALWNYPVWAEDLWQRFGLDRFFERMFLSAHLGVRKPDVAFYRRVVAALALPAEAILFVDDRQQNVDGAVRAGIAAVRFEGPDRLESELRRRGLLGDR